MKLPGPVGRHGGRSRSKIEYSQTGMVWSGMSPRPGISVKVGRFFSSSNNCIPVLVY